MAGGKTPQTRTPDYLLGVERGHDVLVPFDVMDGRQDTIDIASILAVGGGGVFTVNGRSGVVTLTASDVGLANVNNTADADKPISTAVSAALDGKQATLVSGSNIKTVNGFSLLGSGDVSIAGGGGSTNLSTSLSPTNVIVLSDTGTDATIPLSDGTNAGLMAPAQHTKLAGVAAGATANATDAQLRDRATHTGAQAISTVTGLQTALDSKQATLVSGSNIRTVNGATLLGSGDLAISGVDTIQTLTTSGNITAWGSLVRAGSTSPITVTLPDAGGGDIGKRIAVRNGNTGLVTISAGTNPTFNHSNQNVLSFFEVVVFEVTATGVVECVGYSKPFDTTPTNGSTNGITSGAVFSGLAGKINVGGLKTINGNSLEGSGDIAISGGGGAAATNLSLVASPTGIAINSDTGSDVTVPLSDGTNAGLMSPAQHSKLAGIAAGATANATDAQLRDRATHTGTQAISTVTGLQTALDGKQATLVSGSNIKTVNGTSVLGAGDITISNVTNLSLAASPTGIAINSDTGTDVTVPLSDGTNAGLMAPAQHTKLAGVAAGATANATDAQLRDRATHTGTQAAATITGLATVATSGAYADLSGRPTLGTAAPLNVPASGNATSAQVVLGNDTRLSDARTPTAHTHVAADITNFSTAADARIAAASVNDLADVTITTPTTGQVLKFNGTAWVNDADATASGGGATNLSLTASPTGIAINSDTGTDVTVPLSDGTNAGLMAPAQHTKLAGVAAGATANATDAQLRDRATHTGTQLASTISDFNTAADARVAAARAQVNTYTAAQRGATVTVTAVSNIVTLNLAAGNNFRFLPAASFQMANVTGAPSSTDAQSGSLWIVQPAGGACAISFAANWVSSTGAAQTHTTTANTTTRLDYVHDSASGKTQYTLSGAMTL